MSNPEREVTDIAEILAILSKHEVCRIGFNDNLCPYVVPVNFGYEYQKRTLDILFSRRTHREKDASVT
ncbi:putative 5-nitroimidazole antibiotic resistance [Salmonella enterica subsp. enterica]|uniref:Putative 5-nitroimidazole antibiotic resistance n=1 Tax=Salmonella enterica I TaxID=59201 RepID=A0A3S4JC15_SALET|nr:putative 5-nitroimidazole antibiotic resistance [Salmonella enterica subsp. enterica]